MRRSERRGGARFDRVGLSRLIAVLVACAPIAAAEEIPSLEVALQKALARSPLMRAAGASLEAFEAQYREAWWSWWPRMDLKVLATVIPPQAEDADNTQVVIDSTGANTEYRVVTGPDITDWNFWMKVDLTGYVPLYTFGKLSTLKEMAERGVDVGHEARRLAESELRFQVSRAWFGLALAQELDLLIEDGEDKLKKARERLEKLEEEDDPEFDQADLFRLRMYEAQVRKIVLTNRHLKGVSQTGLRVALGLPEAEPLIVPAIGLTALPVTVGPIDCYVDKLARHRPELRMKRHEARVKGIEVDRKWADFWPDFFLAGSFTYAYSTVEQQDTAFSSTVFNALGGGAALGMKLDLDYPGKVARYQRAQADHERVKAELEVALGLIRVELDDVWRTATGQAELLGVQERAMKAARSMLVLRTQEYENGVDDSARFKDVLDAAVGYLSQKSEWLSATYAFNGAVLRLSRLVGEDVVTARCPLTTTPD